MNYSKIKRLVNGLNEQTDSERERKEKEAGMIAGITGQERQNQISQQKNPRGDVGDQINPTQLGSDGLPVSASSPEIQSQLPTPDQELANTQTALTPQGGMIRNTTGVLQSMGKVEQKGAPIMPRAGEVYIDDKGQRRTFGKITTGYTTGDPFYFEFIHKHTDTNQWLLLYGEAPGNKDSSGARRMIPLKVKDIYSEDPSGMEQNKSYAEPNIMQTNTTTSLQEQLTNIKKNIQGSIHEEMDVSDSPAVQKVLQKYEDLAEIQRRVKIGSVYAYFTKFDPKDGQSVYKLLRRIPNEKFFPLLAERKVIDKISEYFPDFATMDNKGVLAVAAGVSKAMNGRETIFAIVSHLANEGLTPVQQLPLDPSEIEINVKPGGDNSGPSEQDIQNAINVLSKLGPGSQYSIQSTDDNNTIWRKFLNYQDSQQANTNRINQREQMLSQGDFSFLFQKTHPAAFPLGKSHHWIYQSTNNYFRSDTPRGQTMLQGDTTEERISAYRDYIDLKIRSLQKKIDDPAVSENDTRKAQKKLVKTQKLNDYIESLLPNPISEKIKRLVLGY